MEENEEGYESTKSRYRTDDTDSDLNKPQWVFLSFYLVYAFTLYLLQGGHLYIYLLIILQ